MTTVGCSDVEDSDPTLMARCWKCVHSNRQRETWDDQGKEREKPEDEGRLGGFHFY